MKTFFALALFTLLAAPAAHAQNAPDPAPAAPANVRFDVVITDDAGAGKVLTKTVTLNVIAGPVRNSSGIGQIRSSARPAGSPMVTTPDGKSVVPDSINLNVDINFPILQGGNKVRVPVVVEYRPYSADPKAASTTVRASIDMLMESGKKTVISQSADPVTDRKVIIEVTPTIQR
jgi:hypothetical protein